METNDILPLSTPLFLQTFTWQPPGRASLYPPGQCVRQKISSREQPTSTSTQAPLFLSLIHMDETTWVHKDYRLASIWFGQEADIWLLTHFCSMVAKARAGKGIWGSLSMLSCKFKVKAGEMPRSSIQNRRYNNPKCLCLSRTVFFTPTSPLTKANARNNGTLQTRLNYKIGVGPGHCSWTNSLSLMAQPFPWLTPGRQTLLAQGYRPLHISQHYFEASTIVKFSFLFC